MFLINPNMIDVDIGTAGLIVVLGMAVVFVGLILLMWVTKIAGKIMAVKEKHPAPAKAASAASSAASSAPASNLARGTAGELKIYDVPPKTAATLMAIVAHKTGKPLNELRFRSIREIK